jgi:hypothetical protein
VVAAAIAAEEVISAEEDRAASLVVDHDLAAEILAEVPDPQPEDIAVAERLATPAIAGGAGKVFVSWLKAARAAGEGNTLGTGAGLAVVGSAPLLSGQRSVRRGRVGAARRAGPLRSPCWAVV